MTATFKACPSDFLVDEVLVADLSTTGPYQYFSLTKVGFTTLEALQLIAGHLGCAPDCLSHGGLKDEDAKTRQYLAYKGDASSQAIVTLNRTFAPGPGSERMLFLQPLGRGSVPLRPGSIEGNAFRITVRGLSHAQVEGLCQQAAINHWFLNYYDRQRFGVPGGPEVTHLVGESLLQDDFSGAFDWLKRGRTTESANALVHTGSARDFFQSLDGRLLALYKSAAAAYEWNRRLSEIVRATERATNGRTTVAGQVLPVLKAPRDYGYLVEHCPQLDIVRFRSQPPDGVVAQNGWRQTVVQTAVRVIDGGAEGAVGGYFARVAFALPSGCYASMALRQLLDGSEP